MVEACDIKPGSGWQASSTYCMAHGRAQPSQPPEGLLRGERLDVREGWMIEAA